MDKAKKQHTEESRSLEIVKLSKVIQVLFVINMVIILSFAFYLYMNNRSILIGFSNNMLYKIPYVGGLLQMIIKSFNIIDINLLLTNIFPLFVIELLYYVIPVIIFQVVLLLLNRRIIKRDHACFSLVFAVVITVSLLIFQPMKTLVIYSTQSSLMSLRQFLILFMLLIQLLCTIMICYNKSKIGRFNITAFMNHQSAHKVMKLGACISFVILLLFSTSLFIGNTKVDEIQRQVSVDYVFNLKEAADGKVSIQIPDKLVTTGKIVGVNIPDTISGGQIVEQFFVGQIDFGSMITNTINTGISNLANKYLIQPMMTAISAIILIAIVISIHFATNRFTLNKLIAYGAQFVFVVVLNVVYAPMFGIVVAIGFGLMFVASLIHVLKEVYELDKVREFISNKRNL